MDQRKIAAGMTLLCALVAGFLLAKAVKADDLQFTWTNPVSNTDGTAIQPTGDTALRSATVVWGTCGGSLAVFGTELGRASVDMPVTTYTVGGLAAGDYCGYVYVSNNAGYSSDRSGVAGKTILPPVPTPTVQLAASPAQVYPYGNAVLTWSSTDAVSCTASGAWTGTQLASGELTVAPAETSTYMLTCINTSGEASASTTVTVVPPPVPQPPEMGPAVVTVATPIYQTTANGLGVGGIVGKAPVGTPCYGDVFKTYTNGTTWYRVESKYVTLSVATDRQLIGKCAPPA